MRRSRTSSSRSARTASTEPTTISRRTSTDAGFTLIELLTVLGLFAILLGIGVGAFRKIGMGRALAVTQVKDALRAARLFAVEQSSVARVEIDKAGNRIFATGFVSAGNWHFEDEKSVGWPTDAELFGGAEIVPDGAIGNGLLLDADSMGWAVLGTSPAFDADFGLRLDLFCKPAEEGGGVLVSKGEAFRLELLADRTLRGSVRVKEGVEQSLAAEGRLSLETPEALPAGCWVQVSMAYDGQTLTLSVAGRERARLSNDLRLLARPDPVAPLMVGSDREAFVGGIDEVRLASIVSRDAPPLPEGVTVAAAGEIYFDGRGRLDANHHDRPVTITLNYDENRRSRDVVVGLLGEIR